MRLVLLLALLGCTQITEYNRKGTKGLICEYIGGGRVLKCTKTYSNGVVVDCLAEVGTVSSANPLMYPIPSPKLWYSRMFDCTEGLKNDPTPMKYSFTEFHSDIKKEYEIFNKEQQAAYRRIPVNKKGYVIESKKSMAMCLSNARDLVELRNCEN